MRIMKRMKPALAVTAVLLTLASTTAFANGNTTDETVQLIMAPAEQVSADGVVSLEGIVEFVDLEGGYYKVGDWALMGDLDFATFKGKEVVVSGKAFDGISTRMVKSLVVSGIELRKTPATENQVISLEGTVEFVEVEGGYYKVGEWALMGDMDFAAFKDKEVIISGKEFDGMSIRMVKSLVVTQIALKGEAKGEAQGEAQGEAKGEGKDETRPVVEPIVVDGAISLEGTIEYTDLEGGFYSIDGVGLIGDETLFKAMEGKRAIVRGKEFTGVSIRQVRQVEVASVMLSVGADHTLPTAITVNGNNLPAGQDAVVVDGVLFVPLRHVVEKAGGKVTWDAKERAVVVEMPDRMAYFRIGEIEAEMNENHVRYLVRNMLKMEKAPVILEGRTMISADALTLVLGLYEVADTDTSMDLAPLK